MNYVDLVAILPYYLDIVMLIATGESGALDISFLRWLLFISFPACSCKKPMCSLLLQLLVLSCALTTPLALFCRILRLGRAFRLVKLGRHSKVEQLLGHVVYELLFCRESA